MKVLIFSRKETRDNSLLLKTLTEAGKTQLFKVPGIMKSKKRNNYFLTPGTIWEITISGQSKEVLIPRESRLIYSPFDEHVVYTELKLLSEFLKPLNLIFPESENIELFNVSTEMLLLWSYIDNYNRQGLINFLYIFMLNQMGMLYLKETCSSCNRILGKKDLYLLNEGPVCEACKNKYQYTENMSIPYSWIKYYYLEYINVLQKHIEEIKISSKNLAELDNTVNYDNLYSSLVFKNSVDYNANIFQYLKTG